MLGATASLRSATLWWKVGDVKIYFLILDDVVTLRGWAVPSGALE